MTVQDFTLTGYQALVETMLGRGYAAVGYADVEPEAAHMILRHDLDMSIQAALPIAEIEAALGLRAHYFVLLRSEMYNPFSTVSQRDLRQLSELGHAIGLHFDAASYPDNETALDEAAARECDVLANIVKQPVEVVSFHRPEPRLQGRRRAIGGRRHAYEPRYFSEMGYCSDSRGGWHHGHPFDHPAVEGGRALQLLTHPIWWNHASARGPVAALDRFRIERDCVLAHELAANCEPYRAAYGNTPPSLTKKAKP